MAEENLVEDHNMTLYEVGFTGAPLDNPEEQVRIYIDTQMGKYITFRGQMGAYV